MSPESRLYAVGEDGKPCFKDLLFPMFQTIFPAFADEAEEIRITAWESEGSMEIQGEYKKRTTFKPLSVHPGFNPGITSIRMRILAGLPLESEHAEVGTIRVRFNDRYVLVFVRVVPNDNGETLLRNPEWNEHPPGEP